MKNSKRRRELWYTLQAIHIVIFQDFKKMKKVPKIKKFFQNFEKTLARNKTLTIIKTKNINIIWEKISKILIFFKI